MVMRTMWKSAILAVLAVLLTAATARAGAIPLVDITGSDPYSSTWGQNLTLGYSFSVETSLTFNALGVFDVSSGEVWEGGHSIETGLNASHLVGVWDGDTLVASATVAPGGPVAVSQSQHGDWVYQTIAPVTLGPGTYTIGAFYGAGSDPVMVRQQAASVITTPGVTYNGGRYVYSDTFGRPTLNFPPNESQYFGPSLLSVPDGGMTLTLLGGALAGLGLFRRRRQA